MIMPHTLRIEKHSARARCIRPWQPARTGVAALLLALSAIRVEAQPVGEFLSREFLEAMLQSTGSGGQFRIRVGVPAEGLPAGIIGADQTVLGSAAVGIGSVTVVTSPRSPEQTRDSVLARVRALGFSAGPTGETNREPGFAPPAVGLNLLTGWCRGQEVITLNIEAREAAGSRLTIMQMRGTPGLCDTATPARTSLRRPGDTPMPFLPAPPGSSSLGGGGNSGGSSTGSRHFTTYATLKTTLPLPEILRHYAERVRESAWTASDSVVASTSGLYTFSIVDAGGIMWHGELAVSRFPGPGAATYEVRFSGRMR